MINNHQIKLVATDLDGTFLRNDKSVSAENLEALQRLGDRGILRVIATGRNLKKTLEVIDEKVPFDYIVFSSGAGIYDPIKKRLLFRRNISRPVVRELSDYLVGLDLNFHLFKPVPENHQCWYHRGSVRCAEFENYFDFHRDSSEPLNTRQPVNSEACQFLVVFPNDPVRFQDFKEKLEQRFREVKIVRTTSPLETGYIWMEIFHPSVSKGNGVKYICDTLHIGYQQTLGIGNDFNDLDLLEFTGHSYIAANGPVELKSRFQVALSNEEHAFAEVVKKYL
jgi:hypothetical protein